MGIIDGIKSLMTAIRKYNDIELTEKIVNLQADVMALIEENHSLKTKLKETKETKKLASKLIFESNSYWLPSKNREMEGPFCSACWDSKKILIRKHTKPMTYGGEYYECPACKSL